MGFEGALCFGWVQTSAFGGVALSSGPNGGRRSVATGLADGRHFHSFSLAPDPLRMTRGNPGNKGLKGPIPPLESS